MRNDPFCGSSTAIFANASNTIYVVNPVKIKIRIIEDPPILIPILDPKKKTRSYRTTNSNK